MAKFGKLARRISQKQDTMEPRLLLGHDCGQGHLAKSDAIDMSGHLRLPLLPRGREGGMAELKL